jgi:capsular polysaccharide biosynthesis protein
MLRRFTNLDEVVRLAQKFTSVTVDVVTVNASTTVTEQIRLFNGFDILITPHGSHLANGIFTMHPGRKALIEVVPFAFDRVFYSNFVPVILF